MAKFIIQKQFSNELKLRHPILVEGLPGIGSVGKIATDYIVDILKPRLLYKIYSHDFSHLVYLNENSKVELPWVGLYLYKTKHRDMLILAGDEHPASRRASYEFCERVLNMLDELGCKELITLGGIGLPSKVKHPRVFGAVTHTAVSKRYRKLARGVNFNANNRVDMIIGVSGVLLGLAELRGMSGMALLTETYAHQAHLGLMEAGVVLEQLKNILNINLDLRNLNSEVAKQRLQRKAEKDELARSLSNVNKDAKYIG